MSDRKNLQKLVLRYLEYCEIEKNLTQSTIKMYHFYLSDFLSWAQSYLGKENLSYEDLDYELIKKYRIYLNRRKSILYNDNFKKTTQKTFLVALRAFFKYLVVEEELDTLSPDKIILGKPDPSIPKVLNDDQMQRLFDVQNLSKRSGVRDRAILEVLFSTGLRVSELVNLNIDDINFNSNEFTVIGKGRKPRTVYLSDSAKSWLKKYISTRNDDFAPLFLRYSGKKMEAGDTTGESLRLTARSIQRLVKKYITRAGVSVDATPHTLRHTFATGLLTEGADLRSVQELLGHASVSTTQLYTHITNKRLKDIHQKFHKDVEGTEASDSPTPASENSKDNEITSIFL